MAYILCDSNARDNEIMTDCFSLYNNFEVASQARFDIYGNYWYRYKVQDFNYNGKFYVTQTKGCLDSGWLNGNAFNNEIDAYVAIGDICVATEVVEVIVNEDNCLEGKVILTVD